MPVLTREEYEEKRSACYNRLIAAAQKAEEGGDASLNQGRDMFHAIPFGQPILVGHHSESRDRNYRSRADGKMRRGFELHNQAQEYRSRAQSIENNNAIYSDNPDAVNLLEEKIKDLEELQAEYKAINAAHVKFLKDPKSLDKSDLSESLKKTIREYVPEYSWVKHPIAPYQLTNLSANIRQAKKRLEEVSRRQSKPDWEETINSVRVEYLPGENRIRVYFPVERVSYETFDELKHSGFRYARSLKCFSAYYNGRTQQTARQIAAKFTAP